jgi:hypothetical protein
MSIVGRIREELESHGEYVVLANAKSGWFAVFPKKVEACAKTAATRGRSDFTLVIYRTRSGGERDHYAIPFGQVSDVLTESTLSTSSVNAAQRWNCTLRDGLLHVTHSKRSIDVQQYHRQPLLCEERHRIGSRLTEEVLEDTEFREGNVVRVAVNRYERDVDARDRCIQLHGTACLVCGFDFGRAYGGGMAGFIHVHHRTPLHTIGADYVVNPETDMVPVCPNCHAVIHSQDPPLTSQAVQELLGRDEE